MREKNTVDSCFIYFKTNWWPGQRVAVEEVFAHRGLCLQDRKREDEDVLGLRFFRGVLSFLEMSECIHKSQSFQKRALLGSEVPSWEGRIRKLSSRPEFGQKPVHGVTKRRTGLRGADFVCSYTHILGSVFFPAEGTEVLKMERPGFQFSGWLFLVILGWMKVMFLTLVAFKPKIWTNFYI